MISPSPTQVIRLVLVEDHAIVRQGVRALLQTHPQMELVGEAENGAVAQKLLLRVMPDIAVVDLSMPDVDGLELVKWMKKECPAVRVVVQTVHEERGYLNASLRAGVLGYVLKRSAAEELIQAVQAVALGNHYIDPALARAPVDLDVGHDADESPDSPRALSRREVEVACLIARGHANKEIARRLNISVKTVETHKGHIMEKLQLQTRAGLVSYALQQGWLAIQGMSPNS